MDFGGDAYSFWHIGCNLSCISTHWSSNIRKMVWYLRKKRGFLLSSGGTLIGWIFFLFALFLPVENLNSINSALIENFVITLPLLVLFFARSIDGITGGNISVANAYLADISSDENRSKNFGKMAMSSNLGFIVGSETDTIFKIGLRRPFKKFTIVGAAATTIIKC